MRRRLVSLHHSHDSLNDWPTLDLHTKRLLLPAQARAVSILHGRTPLISCIHHAQPSPAEPCPALPCHLKPVCRPCSLFIRFGNWVPFGIDVVIYSTDNTHCSLLCLHAFKWIVYWNSLIFILYLDISILLFPILNICNALLLDSTFRESALSNFLCLFYIPCKCCKGFL